MAASAGIFPSPTLPRVLPFVVEVLRVTTNLELCEIITPISNCPFSSTQLLLLSKPKQRFLLSFPSPVKRRCKNSFCNSTDSSSEVTVGSSKRFCSLCLQTFRIQAAALHFSSQLLVFVFRERMPDCLRLAGVSGSNPCSSLGTQSRVPRAMSRQHFTTVLAGSFLQKLGSLLA